MEKTVTLAEARSLAELGTISEIELHRQDDDTWILLFVMPSARRYGLERARGGLRTFGNLHTATDIAAALGFTRLTVVFR